MSQTPTHSGACWLSVPLAWITTVVLRAPRLVLTGAVLLAMLTIGLSVASLQFKTNRLDLLNHDSAFNQRWLAHLEEFGDQDDVVVVVEGGQTAAIAAAMEDVAERVAAESDLFESVMDRRDLTSLRGKALHYLTLEQLQAIDGFLVEWSAVLDGDWSQISVLRMLERAQQRIAAQSPRAGFAGLGDDGAASLAFAAREPSAGETVATEPLANELRVMPAELAPVVGEVAPAGFSTTAMDSSPAMTAGIAQAMTAFEALAAALVDDANTVSPWPEALRRLRELDRPFGSELLLDAEHGMGFVLLRFKTRDGSFTNFAPALHKLRRIVDDAQEAHPEVMLGVTGMPVLENDEMEASQTDTIWTGLVSLVGVAAVFIAGFGGVRRPLMTVAALLIALAWSFGFVTLAIGHLNILSASFGVILIGLGIDFGIHYVTHYAQRVDAGEAPSAALLAASREVGPGIVTGGLTTALAFCTTVLTQFTGVMELGVIAAGGIVLCVVAALTVLPALLVSADAPTQRREWCKPLPIDWLCRPLQLRPKRTLAAVVGLTVLIGMGVGRLNYDHNLLNLQPVGLESATLSRRLATEQDRGVWFAVCSFATREQLLAVRERLNQLEVVSATEEIGSALPEEDAAKAALVARIHKRLEKLPARTPLIPVAAREQLLPRLGHFERFAAATGTADTTAPPLAGQIASLPPAEYFRRLSQFQQRMAAELLEILQAVRANSHPEPPRLDDLPVALADRFVGKSGHLLLRVYGHGDIWNMDALTKFVTEVERVVPEVTGHPVQTYYASRQMQQSYLHAAVYSLLAVSIVLMIDFRRIRYWMLAMVPMGLGMLQMFGLLGWLGIPLNPANLIVLPLILGIGIDDGVHVIHDFARQRGGVYRMSSSTASAVVFTSATTMIGFGSMMFATHQGLRSLGQVLTIGVLCCLVSSLLALPCVLAAISPRASSEPAAE